MANTGLAELILLKFIANYSSVSSRSEVLGNAKEKSLVRVQNLFD
jgi:hypothetical protein